MLCAVESMRSGKYEIEINDEIIKINKSLYYFKFSEILDNL